MLSLTLTSLTSPSSGGDAAASKKEILIYQLTLYCRRQRGDLIETFEILNDFADVQMGAAFTLKSTQLTRGHPFKLVKNGCS